MQRAVTYHAGYVWCWYACRVWQQLGRNGVIAIAEVVRQDKDNVGLVLARYPSNTGGSERDR